MRRQFWGSGSGGMERGGYDKEGDGGDSGVINDGDDWGAEVGVVTVRGGGGNA